MKFNKLFSTKSITNLLYGFLLLMPFCAILGRVIYTQANPNAKDSYSSKTIYQQFAITNDNQFPTNQVINIKYRTNIPSSSCDIYISYISYTAEELNLSQVEYDSITYLRFSGSNQSLYFRDNNNVTLASIHWDNSIDFNLIGTSLPTNQIIYSFSYISQVILVQDNLDNAFEYSLDTFTKDNNLGSVDFFGWFTNLFLNQSKSHNAVYLNFANWYMNYALLVSSGYLIFMVLMWFINYVRRIMDKSMNHDFGGF